MNRKRWSRSEKALILLPALMLLSGVLIQLDLAGREINSVFVHEIVTRQNPSGIFGSGWRLQSCRGSLKAIQTAMAQYFQDNDGRYPPVKTSGVYYGWADAVKRSGRFSTGWHCPDPAPHNGLTALCSNCMGYTDYYLNSNLAGTRRAGVMDLSRTVLVGEGGGPNEANDGRYAKPEVPQKWLLDKTSRANRHLEQAIYARRGAYYLLADGRVEFITPREFENHTYGFNVR